MAEKTLPKCRDCAWRWDCGKKSVHKEPLIVCDFFISVHWSKVDTICYTNKILTNNNLMYIHQIIDILPQEDDNERQD